MNRSQSTTTTTTTTNEQPNKIMKAIQTEYKGYKFRSRLEARWAVFFETLNIKWIYEPEGYVLEDGEHYLPDFLLPDLKTSFGSKKGLYIEVKAEIDLSNNKFIYFGEKSEIPILLLLGNIPYPPPDVTKSYGDDLASGYHFAICSKNGHDFPYLFCECKKCGKIGVEFDGRSARIICDCTFGAFNDKEYNSASNQLDKAYKAARQARFEHGEKPSGRFRYENH